MNATKDCDLRHHRLAVLFAGLLLLQAASTSLAEPSGKPAKPAAPKRGNSPGVPEAHLDYAPGSAPKFWSIAAADTILARHPDFRRAYWRDWTYMNGYVLLGIEQAYRATGNAQYLEFIKKYIDNFVDQKGRFRGGKLNALDNFMTGNAIVMMYEYTHDPRYKSAATQMRKAFDTYPRSSDGQFWHNTKGPDMWIDGVFMGQMFLIRYGKSIGDSNYAWDEATKQITVFARHCRKGDSGLYLHAWTEQQPRPKWAEKDGVSCDVWSEGLGWYALVVPETLAVLPKTHPKYAEVLDIYKRLMAGLKKTQDAKTGGWFMIVDKGDRPDNWIDPSGTSMFVYSIRRGIELGLLDKAEFEPIASRGYRALCTFATINERGLVDIRGGGDGICIQNDYAAYVHYKHIVNAKETVGGMLLAAGMMEKAEVATERH